MKLTIQKIALLIVMTIFSLIGLDVLDFSQMNRVFESTNYTKVNMVPSIRERDNAFTELRKIRAQYGQDISLTDKVKMAEIEQLMETELAKVDLALKTYETAKISDVNSSAERNDVAMDLVLANQTMLTLIAEAFEVNHQYNIDQVLKYADEATIIRANASEELAATAEEMTSQPEQLQDLMRFFRANNLVSEANSVKVATTASETNMLRKVAASNNYIDKADFVNF